jgi:cob(I)alamin adenosyltransferase
MSRPRLDKGLIQVYTGDSKGKTTAALGLCLRAVGHGFHVCFIQFIKGGAYTGELFSTQRLYPNFKFLQYGVTCPYSALIRQGEDKCHGCGKCFPFMDKDKNNTEHEKMAHLGFSAAEQAVSSGEYDIVVLDEINQAIYQEFLSPEDVLALFDKKQPFVEVILTGRNAHPKIVERADLVTEMTPLKHPFQKGISSRRGIEY